MLREALRLIRAWGFTYKKRRFLSGSKEQKGGWLVFMGWASGRTQRRGICLLATKGHPKRQAADIHQFIISPIEARQKAERNP